MQNQTFKKPSEFQIFKTWALTVLLSSALTFAATVMFAAPILLSNDDITAFWKAVFN